MQVSGSTTRLDFSVFACSIARMILAVLLSKSPLMVLIWPMVTRITEYPAPSESSTQFGLVSTEFCACYILSTTHAEGSHNGSAAVLKTAGRKAMQVRVLSPPPFAFNNLHPPI